ncbi:MAG TPA: hypothetical protein VNL71_09825, partial [Chloroflexota bacterium]|nr:hypothetical protein [Chloroflexota bacterium]
DVLEKQLSGLVHTLQNPGNAAGIANIESQIGAGLAKMTVAAIQFGEAIGPYVGSAIAFIARAWPLVEQGAQIAFDFVGGIVSQFGNWLQNTGFPAIEKVINAIANAWIAIQPTVSRVMGTLADDFSRFVVAVSNNAGPLMNGLAGAFQIGMGAVELAFGGALDLLSGDWAKFKNDFNSGVNDIIIGAANLIAAIETGWGARLGNALMGPWTELAQGVRMAWRDIGDVVAAGVGAITYVMTNVEGVFARMVNHMIDGFNEIAAHVPGMAQMAKLVDPSNATYTTYAPLVGPYAGKQPLTGPYLGTGPRPEVAGPRPMVATVHHIDYAKLYSDQARAAFDKMAPGIDLNQYIHAGVSNAQFAANIEKARQQVIASMTGMIPGGGAVGATYATSSGPGAEVLTQIKALFKDLGGKFTLKDLLASFGLTDIGQGNLAYTPPGSLPVLSVGGTPAAATTAGGSTAGGSLHLPTGRVPLGALGATFMSTMATAGKLGSGTDPATVAAQKAADTAANQYSEEQRHTTLMQQQTVILTDLR